MPSSVLLAILVGAGVLALMPALVRRYDAVVRGQAELHNSSMRVLLRRRRQRTVPGAAPINPPSFVAGARAMGRATVPDSLTPGDAESDALVGAALAGRSSGEQHTEALPVGPVRTAAPVRRPLVDAAQVRQWRRFRRRRVLLAFSLLLVTQTIGAIAFDPGFWAGVGVSAVLTLAYLVRLRAAAAAERRELAAERARRHRAYEFVRVATRHARVDDGAAARAAAWLATPRATRRRPTREVLRVLTLAGRDATRCPDGSWLVRKAPDPVPGRRRPLLPRTGRTRTAASVASDVEAALPRAVNS